jgi:branched-chain amino acid transport system substrate-binding protein
VAGSSNGANAPGLTANSVNVGLLTSLTGPVAAGFTTVATGFIARVELQNAAGGVNGRRIDVVLGDDQGTTAGALAAAQTLVQQKQVFATGLVSVVGFAAQPYLTREGVPVTGTPLDGPEWSPPNYNTFFKQQAAANVAVVANNSPSAVAAAKNVGASAKAAGLKATYRGCCSCTCLCAGQHAHSLSQSCRRWRAQALDPVLRRPPCRLGTACGRWSHGG